MCRLAAFPPGFPREDAIEILKNFENNNTDGTGAAWIDENGNFIVEKYPKSLTKILRRRRFLDHMPHNGWTIAHLRAASVGDNKFQNTHPFIAGKWAVCHNGSFSEHKIVRLALSNKIKFEGETDSEAAAHLLSVSGPKKFSENVDFSGVFLALNQNGELWAIKTSGDLEIQALTQDRVLLSSSLSFEKFERPVEAHIGWYHFDKAGCYIKHKKQRDSWEPHRPRVVNHVCGPYADSMGAFNNRQNVDGDSRHQYYYPGSGCE